jgi:hypothetical protein
MPNITLEHYIKAIKERYEEVKNGDNSHFLESPSQAKLRKLCWEIFLVNTNSDDQKTFSTLFEFCFDLSKKNALQAKTDKFKSIGAFYRGRTENPTEEIIELAAVLVDFELRPFGKFKKFSEEGRILERGEDLAIAVLQEEIKLKVETVEKNNPEDVELIEDLRSAIDLNNEETLIEEEGSKENISSVAILKPIGFVGNVKRSFFERIIKKSKPTIIATTIISCLVGTIIYFAFFKKNCIQWSDNHYEIVDCTLGIEGNVNDILPLDKYKSLLDFRRLEVCDTTTCFKNNNEAIVWYVKTANGVDYFNTYGVHPETKRALRPVTHYIINKYVKNHCK